MRVRTLFTARHIPLPKRLDRCTTPMVSSSRTVARAPPQTFANALFRSCGKPHGSGSLVGGKMFDGQQVRRQRGPLGVQRAGESRAPCPAIPITRVERIALFAMQVGVDPGSVRTLNTLRDRVRALLIAMRLVPQRMQKQREIPRPAGGTFDEIGWTRGNGCRHHVRPRLLLRALSGDHGTQVTGRRTSLRNCTTV